MPRRQKDRPPTYKIYYEKDVGGEIPENTLRSMAEREKAKNGAQAIQDEIQVIPDAHVDEVQYVQDEFQAVCGDQVIAVPADLQGHFEDLPSQFQDEEGMGISNSDCSSESQLDSATPVPSPTSSLLEMVTCDYGEGNGEARASDLDKTSTREPLDACILQDAEEVTDFVSERAADTHHDERVQQSSCSAFPQAAPVTSHSEHQQFDCSGGVEEEDDSDSGSLPLQRSSHQFEDSDLDIHPYTDNDDTNSIYEGEPHEAHVDAVIQQVQVDNNLLPNLLLGEGFGRLKKHVTSDFSTPVTETVHATKGEIMLNALALCRHHNWGHREKANLLKFVNTIFGQKVLPESRYLLDKLFYSQEGLHFFFYCKSCSHSFGELTETERKSVKLLSCPNPVCLEENNVSNLLESSFFVTFDIPHQLELLFKDEKFVTKLHNVFDTPANSNVLSDLYTGCCYRKFAVSLSPTMSGVYKILSFTMSVDGAALFVSSKCSIWPCFLMVNELPPVLRMQNLLIAGLWFGSHKAQMDLFLQPVSDHIRKLGDPGFSVCIFNDEVWKVKAYLIACCADSGARGDVQGIHSHRGEFGCSWCLHKGIEYGKARKYPFLFPPAEERTFANMVRDATVALETNNVINGVKFVPCIASLPKYDNVEGMIVDWLHVGPEGNAKKFTCSWIDGPAGTPYYIGSPDSKSEIEKLISLVKPPVEVRKYLKGLSHMAYWTGREWENWLLFYSVPILMNILPMRYLRHFILFVQAAHLLLRQELPLDLLDVAEKLLIEFVGMTQELYGLSMMRFNVHLLLHLPKHVLRWGALWAVSAYCFEAGNQDLKKVVLAMNGVPQQICRAVSEDKALLFLKHSVKSEKCLTFCDELKEKRIVKIVQVGNVKLLGSSKVCRDTLSEEEVWLCNHMQVNIEGSLLFDKVMKEGIVYSAFQQNPRGGRTVRSDNSFARLCDGRVVKISQFMFSECTHDLNVFCHIVRCIPHLCPLDVVKVDPSASFLFRVTEVDVDKILIPVSLLKGIFVNLQFPHGHFISLIPNVFNMV